jgi:hypothetical protein
MKKRFIFSLCLLGSLAILFTFSIPTQAQSASTSALPKTADAAGSQDSGDKEPLTFGSLEEEMRAKRKIKLDEKQYQENLDRAREADKLSLELIDSYEKTKALTREDTKKLERLEKLTRKIRSEAGGSDEDTSIDNPPNELKLALSRLGQVTTALRKVVEKTPRQVVSATVIQQANVILQLVRITRDLFH